MIPPNPAELLNSQRTSDLIEEARETYDIVIFDTPPVLQVTDAAILGKKVKGTLMVYKAGDIPRTSLKRSTDLLRNMEIDLLGIVLNGISAEMGSDYEDFGYGSYYSYGVEETSRGTGLAVRLRSYVHGWRNRNGDGAAQHATQDRPDDERGTGKRTTSLLSHLVLGLTCLGLVWQSGYLHKPLGVNARIATQLDLEAFQPVAADVLFERLGKTVAHARGLVDVLDAQRVQ